MAAMRAEVRESTLRFVTAGQHEDTSREGTTAGTDVRLAAHWVTTLGPDGREHLELRWQAVRPSLKLL